MKPHPMLYPFSYSCTCMQAGAPYVMDIARQAEARRRNAHGPTRRLIEKSQRMNKARICVTQPSVIVIGNGINRGLRVHFTTVSDSTTVYVHKRIARSNDGINVMIKNNTKATSARVHRLSGAQHHTLTLELPTNKDGGASGNGVWPYVLHCSARDGASLLCDVVLGVTMNTVSAHMIHDGVVHALQQVYSGNTNNDVTNTSSNASGSICVVCLDQPSAMLFLPCKHMCVCSDCLTQLDATCPLCRSHITRVLHTNANDDTQQS